MILYVKLVPIGIYYFEDPSKLDDLRDYILSKETQLLKLERTWKSDDNSPTSARYKSYNFLGDEVLFPYTDEIPTLFRSFLKRKVDQFYQDLNWPLKKRWLQCWVNIHHRGQNLKLHTHKDCKLSGHLTVTCTNSRTHYVSDAYMEVVNEPGMLTLIGRELFPHGTSSVESDEPRISIAFDLYESDEKRFPHWVSLDE